MAKEDAPTRRVHIHIYEHDYQRIMRYFGGTDGVGFSKAIRSILTRYMNKLEEQALANAKQPHISSDIAIDGSNAGEPGRTVQS